ncbi:response regulator [Desulfosediminicola sp.]|uniref:response regulator n=1 Tax=Desulfosediminicola sp. TaxID=2886825 RepID=UPI003AF216C1
MGSTKTILIVDDEARLLESVHAGLKEHEDRLEVITAQNGREAVEILKSIQVHLVVTDIKMPELDGFELLAHISGKYPSIPVIVMTAFNTPEIEQKLLESSRLKLLEKPLDIDELANSIFEGLKQSKEEGALTGISLPSFLQLIETEKKTCIIEVTSNGTSGYIYFNQGVLFSAVYNELKGDEAIYAMLLFDEVEIRIKRNVKRKFKKTVEGPLMAFLMEGLRRKDEASGDYEKSDSPPVAGFSDNEEDRLENTPTSINVTLTKEGDNQMTDIKNALSRLADVEGFMAVGIFTPNGEMAAELNNSGLKIAELGSMANDVLLKAQKSTEMMGVGRGQLVHINAPKAQILARCYNENTDFSVTEAGKAHLHLVLVLSESGNLAMAKMKLESVIHECAESLR